MERRSKSFIHNNLRLHFLEQNEQGSPVAVFLHGWLDHCHGFDWLWDSLPRQWRLVGLDFRGHGKSSQIPIGAIHHFLDYLADIDGLLQHLGHPVHLIGHSMGGAIALLFAAVRPEVVLSVTAIESLGPSSAEPQTIGSKLNNFVRDLNKPIRKRLYPSIEAAVARVRENNSSLSEAAARHLTTYGLEPVDSGFQFTFDPVLRRRNVFPFTEEQLCALFRSISSKVLVIHGTHGFSFDDCQMQDRLACLKVVGPVAIEGGHHVHLDHPKEVASQLTRFVEGLTTA